MQKRHFEMETEGFYGAYWKCKTDSDCAMIAMIGDDSEDYLARTSVKWLHKLGVNVMTMSPAKKDYGHHNYPLERIEKAISWLKTHGNRKIGIVGASTTGTLALTAASYFEDLTLTIGLTPSDFIWQGFMQGKKDGCKEWPIEGESLFSYKGEPLPYMSFCYKHPDYWHVIEKETKRTGDMINSKSLARISSQPGKTQTINFYNVNDAMYLVDLPGYGYANANIEIKAKWGQMIENYLHTSKKLQAVFLLIDIRHEPSDNDIMMYDWMVNQGFAPIIIATKSDKLKKSQIAAHIKTIKDVLHVKPGTVVIPFSSMSKEGRDEIWNLIDSLVFDEDTLLAMKQEEEAKREAKSAAKRAAASQPHKKERWKKTGKPVAKKTKERRDKAKSKKSVNNHKKK